MSAASNQEQLQALLKRGYESLSAGRIADAGECCRRVLAAEPKLVQGHFLVGLVALEAKDRKTALQAFGSVTALEPNHAAAWAQLAKLFMTEGQVNRADAALTAKLFLAPAIRKLSHNVNHERRKKMEKVEKILQDAAVIAQPLWKSVFTATTDRVKGYQTHPTFYHQFGKVWLA